MKSPNGQLPPLSKKSEAALVKLLTIQWSEFLDYLAFKKEPRQIRFKNVRVLKTISNGIKTQ
jgi:hypothetical protein